MLDGARSRRGWWAMGAITAALALPAGCASAGGSQEPEAGRPEGAPVVVKITVVNNLQPRTQVTVRLQSGGVTRILGSALPGREQVFEVENPTLTGEHRLTAVGSSLGEALVSQPFSLFRNSWMTWDLVVNTIQPGVQIGVEP